jgi:hypothetical protein
MEKIKEIITNLSERFSSPLIFSFISSWIVINWQISISLIWYDSDQISNAGFNNIFDFINSKLNIIESFCYPLSVALIYTFIYPLLRNVIEAFIVWTESWGEKWNLSISKQSNVSIEKYIKLREDYDKRSKILESTISNETFTIDALETLKTESLKLKDEFNQLRISSTDLQEVINSLFDLRVLSGHWINVYETESGEKGSENIFIDGDNYFTISNFGQKILRFHIVNFCYDIRTKKMFFTKEVIENDKKNRPINEHFSINTLVLINKDTLEGTENTTTKIRYRKN